MKRSEGRIRTTHAGRLPTPPGCEGLPMRLFRGEKVEPAVIDAGIDHVVGKQLELGIDVVHRNPSEAETPRRRDVHEPRLVDIWLRCVRLRVLHQGIDDCLDRVLTCVGDKVGARRHDHLERERGHVLAPDIEHWRLGL